MNQGEVLLCLFRYNVYHHLTKTYRQNLWSNTVGTAIIVLRNALASANHPQYPLTPCPLWIVPLWTKHRCSQSLVGWVSSSSSLHGIVFEHRSTLCPCFVRRLAAIFCVRGLSLRHRSRGALALCVKHYHVMHTLSVEENIQTLREYCQRRGGNLWNSIMAQLLTSLMLT